MRFFKKNIKYFLPLLVVVGAFNIFAWLVPQARLLLPNFFGMSPVMLGVYTNKDMPLREKWQVYRNVKRAKLTIAEFFNGSSTRTVIIACSTHACARTYGKTDRPAPKITDGSQKPAGPPASFVNTPPGNSRFIVLGPKEYRTPYALMYHLAGLEIAKRVGASASYNTLPVWFRYGLAAYASQDPRLGVLAWRGLIRKNNAQPDVTRLITPQDWEMALRKKIPVHILAREAFARWYSTAGKKGLGDLIVKVREGKPFSKTYPVAFMSEVFGR